MPAHSCAAKASHLRDTFFAFACASWAFCIMRIFLIIQEKPLAGNSSKGRIIAVPPLFECIKHPSLQAPIRALSVNGDEAESLNYLISQTFCDSVQKLPSITFSSKHLSAHGRFSLGSLVMYSSFSLPLSILPL